MTNYKDAKLQNEKYQTNDGIVVERLSHVNNVSEAERADFQLLADSYSEFEEILKNRENPYDHSHNLLYRYYAEVGKHPLLTPEEELYYGRLVHKGDQAAIDKLMQGNLRLVIMLAQRYENRGVELADLISEGNLGLRHAIGKYDPERNFRFSTYAVWWIRYYIETAIMNHGRTIRIPIHINKLIAKLIKSERELSRKLQREVTVSELAKAIDLTIFEVMKLQTSSEASISLDGLLGDNDNRDLYDVLPGTLCDDLLDKSLDSEVFSVLESVVSSLTDPEKEVIAYRFGINGKRAKTLEVTGEKMGITRDQVRYLQLKTLEKIRSLLNEQEIELEDLLTG